MRILCQWELQKHASIYDGWARVFKILGHEFTFWYSESQPAFDAFDESNPDIFILTGPQQYSSYQKCIAERRGMRVADQSIIHPAFDYLLFQDAKPRQEMACDVVYVGNFDANKLPYLEAISSICNLKVFGFTSWPIPEYLGAVNEKSLASAYASCRVGVNLSDRHSERLWQVIGAGRPCLTMDADGRFPCDGLNIPITPSINCFVGTLTHILEDKFGDYVRDGKLGQEGVLRGETYFDRVAQMFDECGYKRESSRVLEVRDATIQLR